MGRSEAFAGAGTATIGTGTSVLRAANPSRSKLIVSNDHAVQVLYLALGTAAVANRGIRIPAGGVFVLEDWTGAVNAIASGAGTVATYVEY